MIIWLTTRQCIIQKLRDGGHRHHRADGGAEGGVPEGLRRNYDDYAKSVGQDVIDLFTGGY